MIIHGSLTIPDVLLCTTLEKLMTYVTVTIRPQLQTLRDRPSLVDSTASIHSVVRCAPWAPILSGLQLRMGALLVTFTAAQGPAVP